MMSFRARPRSSFLGLTALWSCLCARDLSAQTSEGAAQSGDAASNQIAAAEEVAAVDEAPPSTDPVAFQAQSQLGVRSSGQDDSGNDGDFLHRYAPQANLWEAGVFVGPLFISDDNSFRGPIIVSGDGTPNVKPISQFKQPAVELGLRGGYFPLSFLGGEVEGMLAMAETDDGNGVTVLGGRAHVMVQSPFWSVVPFLLGGVGYWHVRNDVSGNDSDPAFHFGGGAKVNVTENLAVRLDIRDNITNQRGTGDSPHSIEALAGANLVFGRKPLASDGDRDGVLDDRDQCPLEAGTLANGCPIRDTDSDGLLDPDDQCPQEVGVAPSGCPILDADQDGVLDADDQCASEKGGAPTGCPDGDQDGFLDRVDRCPALAGVAPDGCVADGDGDGFLGADDKCPDQAETKNGFEDTDGCPDELPAAVQSFVGVIAGIEFDNNQATIRPGSDNALEQAVKVLTDYPSLRVQILGHTDDRGPREYNLELSQRRAESVKAHLVARGIDASRIETKGEGPDAPLSSNASPDGRQKNRRIEFRVLQ